MTPQEAADQLNGGEYGEEGSKELFKAMAHAGLVAVYGASDDNMEFSGAINDEVGCYGGGMAYLNSDGLLQNDCSADDCPYFVEIKKTATTIKAVWCIGEFSWTFETTIPHVKFIINEDGEPFCEGIVFALADVTGAA